MWHAYFIGGPRDLTKTAVRDDERAVFFAEVDTPFVVDHDAASAPRVVGYKKHRYKIVGDVDVPGTATPILVYVYDGVAA